MVPFNRVNSPIKTLLSEDYMKKNIVCISENAFMSILISAIESYPSRFMGERKPNNSTAEGEVFGLLFGQKSEKPDSTIYNVALAIPTQILMLKNHFTVEPSIKHLEKVREIIETFPMYQYLGSYHSHPFHREEFFEGASVIASDADVSYALWDSSCIEAEAIMAIIGLTYLTKKLTNVSPKSEWYYIQNYCGKYKYNLGAHVTERENNSLKVVDNLLCPFAFGINNCDLNSTKR